VAKSGWVAIVSASRIYCALTDNGTPPAETFPQRVGLTLDGTNIKWYVAE
jgi:hypothetical protein